ncbi:hypothetical protein V6N13_048373 [Hibiscus sabdariffa]
MQTLHQLTLNFEKSHGRDHSLPVVDQAHATSPFPVGSKDNSPKAKTKCKAPMRFLPPTERSWCSFHLKPCEACGLELTVESYHVILDGTSPRKSIIKKSTIVASHDSSSMNPRPTLPLFKLLSVTLDVALASSDEVLHDSHDIDATIMVE